jgi:hypothetical protein
MRLLILPLLSAALLGFAVQRQGLKQLRITTADESSIVVYTVASDGEEIATTMGNRTLLVCLSAGDTLELDDLDSVSFQGRISDGGRVSWEGNFEVKILAEEGSRSRIRVTDGSAVLEPVEEGFCLDK